jgi:uncharacterized protein
MTRSLSFGRSRRRLIMCAFATIGLLLAFGASGPAYAQSLNDLRASGKVGEAFDGYARARDGSVQGQVNAINAKRRAIYNKRASEQGTAPDQVGRVYASQIIAKSPGGTWVLSESGTWRQK